MLSGKEKARIVAQISNPPWAVPPETPMAGRNPTRLIIRDRASPLCVGLPRHRGFGRIFLPEETHGNSPNNSRISDYDKNRGERATHCPKAIPQGPRLGHRRSLCRFASWGWSRSLALTTAL